MIFTVPTIGLAMPTESEWGRLYEFNGSGDAGLIMPFRSYYFRDFFAGEWKDIAFGFIHCTMGNGGGDTADVVSERLVEDAPINLFHFGLTQSTDGTVPVGTNPSFIGMRGIVGGITQIMTSPLQLAQLAMTSVTTGVTTLGDTPIQIPFSQGVSGTPFSMVGIRLIYNALNNTIFVNFQTQTNIALADDAANTTTLNTFLQGISASQDDPFASFPYQGQINFRTFYIYWPYLINRLKLQCVGVLKNA